MNKKENIVPDINERQRKLSYIKDNDNTLTVTYKHDWYDTCKPFKEFKDNKGVIRTCKSKNRQYNGQKKKRTNNDLQNTTQKTKDLVTHTPLKTEMNSDATECYAVPARLVTPVVLILLQTR